MRELVTNPHQCIVEWGKVCDSDSYDVWYRLDFCLSKPSRNKFKEAGNCQSLPDSLPDASTDH